MMYRANGTSFPNIYSFNTSRKRNHKAPPRDGDVSSIRGAKPEKPEAK